MRSFCNGLDIKFSHCRGTQHCQFYPSWTSSNIGIECHQLTATESYSRITSLFYDCVFVAQSCLTLCDPIDYSLPGILQARILEWVAISFSRGYS